MAGWRAASPPPHRVGSRAADCRCLVILCPLLFIFSYYFFVCSVVESLKDLLDEKIVEVFREELHLSCNEHVCLIISIQCKKTVNLFKDLMFLDKQFYQCLFAISLFDRIHCIHSMFCLVLVIWQNQDCTSRPSLEAVVVVLANFFY